MKPRHALVLIGGLFTGVLSPAFAAVSSSARVDFSIRLIDLDPSDGITPFIDVAIPQDGEWEMSVPGQSSNKFGIKDLTDKGASLSSPGASTAASMDWSGNAIGGGGAHVFSVSGTLDQPLTGQSASSYTSLLLPFGSNLPFTLSAHTLAIFSADLHMRATSTVGSDASVEYEGGGVGFRLLTNGTGSDGTGQQSQYLTDSVNTSPTYEYDPITGQYLSVYLPQDQVRNVKTGVTFLNTSAFGIGGTFDMRVSAGGYSALRADPGIPSVPGMAVPEPESMALAAAGLLVMAGRMRRAVGTHTNQ